MLQLSDGKCPILYLDDNSDDHFFFRRSTLRTETPFHIEHFSSAEPALAYLRGDAPYGDRMFHPWPAFLLCDYCLRTTLCHDLVSSIRATPSCRALSVIIFSDAISDGSLTGLYEAGADHFLRKPVPDRLDIIVQSLYGCATSKPRCFDSLKLLQEHRPKPVSI